MMDKEHFKECAPEETVAKLKSILSEMGIETEKQMVLTSSIGTHSMRVIFKGSNFGTTAESFSTFLRASLIFRTTEPSSPSTLPVLNTGDIPKGHSQNFQS